MNTPLTSTARSYDRRSAFTLTEMLIVIAIIGILVALLTPAVMRGLISSQEFTITSEMQQLDAQIEQFRIEHGFYPPTIGDSSPAIDGTERGHADFTIRDVASMRRFLNRIAPNNSESSTGGLQNWWSNVGQHLDERTSLVFWLNGLCKNKQFPLSGNQVIANNPSLTLSPSGLFLKFDGNEYSDADAMLFDPAFSSANDISVVERDSRFEFVNERLQPINKDGSVLFGYNQPAGRNGGDLMYRYLDNRAYDLGSMFESQISGYGDGTTFSNPDTFQIVAPGMDGFLTDPDVANPSFNFAATGTNRVGSAQLDNICNFIQGRLEKLTE